MRNRTGYVNSYPLLLHEDFGLDQLNWCRRSTWTPFEKLEQVERTKWVGERRSHLPKTIPIDLSGHSVQSRIRLSAGRAPNR